MGVEVSLHVLALFDGGGFGSWRIEADLGTTSVKREGTSASREKESCVLEMIRR